MSPLKMPFEHLRRFQKSVYFHSFLKSFVT